MIMEFESIHTAVLKTASDKGHVDWLKSPYRVKVQLKGILGSVNKTYARVRMKITLKFNNAGDKVCLRLF